MDDDVEPTTKEAYLRLGQLVESRRKALDLKQNELPKGPSSTTVSQIENGEPAGDLAYKRLEQSLQWSPGSVSSILAGGDPTPLGAPSPLTPEPPQLLHGFIEDYTRLLIDLIIASDQVDAAASTVKPNVANEAQSLMLAIDRLSQRVHDEARKWLGATEAIAALKADVVNRRRLRRMGLDDNTPDLISRMAEIIRVHDANEEPQAWVGRLVEEAARDGYQLAARTEDEPKEDDPAGE